MLLSPQKLNLVSMISTMIMWTNGVRSETEVFFQEPNKHDKAYPFKKELGNIIMLEE